MPIEVIRKKSGKLKAVEESALDHLIRNDA